MRRKNSKTTRRWIIKVSIIILVLCTMSFTYAAYTNYSYMKGVAVSKMNSTAFSSNYLHLAEQSVSDDEMEEVMVPIQVDDEGLNASQSLVFQIRNYSENNPSEPNMEDITYTLNVVVKPKDGETLSRNGYKLDDVGMTIIDSKYQGTIIHSLQGEKLDVCEHILEIPTQDLDKIEIYATATPDTKSLLSTNKKILAAKVVITQYSTELENSSNWIGQLVDMEANEDDSSSQKYAALNYELAGTGQKILILQWNADEFELDPYFIQSMSSTSGSEIEGTLTTDNLATLRLHVDSNKKDYYLLQFYRKQPIDTEETWSKLNNMFTFTIENLQANQSE